MNIKLSPQNYKIFNSLRRYYAVYFNKYLYLKIKRFTASNLYNALLYQLFLGSAAIEKPNLGLTQDLD
jgi:hypothetical protein